MLLEQHGGTHDGEAQHIGSRTHPAAAGLLKQAAAVVGQHQGHRVEHMDGRAHVGGSVGAVQHPNGTGKKIGARHIVGAQIQPGGQDHIAGQCDGHTAEQRQAQPPEVLPRGLPQQVEQGEGDPCEPCKVGQDGVFAEGDQIVQPAVHQQDTGHGDLRLQKVESGQIQQKIQRHEPDGVARKPVAFHGKKPPFCDRANS